MNYIDTKLINQLDINNLIGLSFNQACFGRNEIIIWLDPGASITIFGSDDFLNSPKRILRFLNSKILGASINTINGDLELLFKEGEVSILNNDEFESFIIDLDNKSYVSRKVK